MSDDLIMEYMIDKERFLFQKGVNVIIGGNWDRGLRKYVEAFSTRQLFKNKSAEYDKDF